MIASRLTAGDRTSLSYADMSVNNVTDRHILDPEHATDLDTNPLWRGGWKWFDIDVPAMRLRSHTRYIIQASTYRATCPHKTGRIPNKKCPCGLHYVHDRDGFLSRAGHMWNSPQMRTVIDDQSALRAALCLVHAHGPVRLDKLVSQKWGGATALRARTLTLDCILLSEQFHVAQPGAQSEFTSVYGVDVGVFPEVLTGRRASEFMADVEKLYGRQT
ncbi:hypothetical protein P9990_23580 [Prescottella equi]|uniref:hypothetical protein n=1 Tax=Prescottella TaxID=2979332 RepID=UPI002576CC09|nr:hypothetical protein [Prescottella equi]WJJ11503.1 hypothetical protein P9990_23580 [Prescottella equi]